MIGNKPNAFYPNVIAKFNDEFTATLRLPLCYSKPPPTSLGLVVDRIAAIAAIVATIFKESMGVSRSCIWGVCAYDVDDCYGEYQR